MKKIITKTIIFLSLMVLLVAPKTSMAAVNLTINGVTDGNFFVNDTWILRATTNPVLANKQVEVCTTAPYPNNSCTPAGGLGVGGGLTDASGNFSLSGSFPASSIGIWNEYVKIDGQVVSNPVTFSVSVGQTANCAISNFTANPSSINSGQSANLSWNTTNCNSANISSLGTVNTSGVQNVSPNTTTTYMLTAYGVSGSQVTRSVTVTVNQPVPLCAISNFTANPSSINSGQSANLSWNTTNCNSANISSLGTVNTSGSQTVSPSSTTTYTLTALGSGGTSQSQSVTIIVNNYTNNCSISYFNASSNYVYYGSPVTLSWATTGCNSVNISNLGNVNISGSQVVYPTYNTNYILNAYSGTGSNQTQSVNVNVNTLYGGGNNNYNYCAISYFTANQLYTTPGSGINLSWNTNNCTSVSISGVGLVNLSGNRSVYPTSTTLYTLSAYGPANGYQTQSVNVIVNSNNNFYSNTCAVTTVATNVNARTATLNGLISNPSGDVNAYFEYGTSVGLGSTTSATIVNGSYSQYVSNLIPDTTYFFRAVAQCSGGTSYGTIEVFDTDSLGSTTSGGSRSSNPGKVEQGATVSGSQSQATIKIENRYQTVSVGDTIDYTITYKNTSKGTLTTPKLQIIAPKGITLLNFSRGIYSKETNTLNISLEDLKSGAEGTFYTQGKVDSASSGTAQIATTAIFIYTNSSGAENNVIAYALNNIKGSSNSLAASAFFSGLSGIGIIGWLLVIIVILMIILIIRSFGNKSAAGVSTQGH